MKIVFLSFLLLIKSYSAQAPPNKDECLSWSNRHVKPTKHIDYFNVSVVLVEFTNFSDMNVICTKTLYENITRLRLKVAGSSSLLLPTNFNINDLLYMFQFKYQSIVSIRNLRGFLMSPKPDYIENEIFYLGLYDLNFDFFLNETHLVTKENCLRESFRNVNFFSSILVLTMEKGTLYKQPICPYIFYQSQLKEIVFNEISNSLIFRNRLSFISLNEKRNVNIYYMNKLDSLTLNVAYIDVGEEMVNKYVFRNILQLNLNGIVMSIEETLFRNLIKIKMISIQSDNFAVFLNKGLKWLDCINEDVEVNLERKHISK
jgi:hypothetical protein